MDPFIRLGGTTALLTGLLVVSGCSPEKGQAPVASEIGSAKKPFTIKPGVLLPYEPQSGEELHSSFGDLLEMVRLGQLSPDEAREFIRFKKMQLGLENPTGTPGFDKLLRQQELK